MRIVGVGAVWVVAGCTGDVFETSDTVDWSLSMVDGQTVIYELDYEVSGGDGDVEGRGSFRLFGTGTYFGGSLAMHVLDGAEDSPDAANLAGEVTLSPDLDTDDEFFLSGFAELPLASGTNTLTLGLVLDGADLSASGDFSLTVVSGSSADLPIITISEARFP
ncbi:MAG: hypothetical protein KTR31_19930 [Myxococcales bacterium]|nr:hypothetical protein [Myxococcales bacterium]